MSISNIKVTAAALTVGAVMAFAGAVSAATVNCGPGSGLTCLVDSGSPYAAQSPGNSVNDKEVSVEAALAAALSLTSIDLTLLGKSDAGYGTSVSGKSGTFAAPSMVSYFTVKAGTGYLIFDGMNSTSSAWSTAGLLNGGGNQPGVSHISYWSASPVATVPLPAAGLMLLAGLGGIAAIRRCKKS